MPLAKLQEIGVICARHFFSGPESRADVFDKLRPYRCPAFAFSLDGNHLKFTDNTQAPVTPQDGLIVMGNMGSGRFDLPERNKVKAAFLKFEHWQNRILESRNHPNLENLESAIEVIAGRLLPLAVKMLKSTAKSYFRW